MNIRKFGLLALSAAAAILIACGDDGSTSVGPASDSEPASSESVTPASSDSGVPASSEDNSAPASSESAAPASSADAGVGTGGQAPEGSICRSEVFPQITISNIENINMSCNAASEGWTVLNTDVDILYTCKSDVWEETPVVDCN